jgi:hypothetical protein
MFSSSCPCLLSLCSMRLRHAARCLLWPSCPTSEATESCTMALMQVEKYRRRLELLGEGRLVEAMLVQTGGNSATAKAVDGMQDAGGESFNCNIAHCLKQGFTKSSACMWASCTLQWLKLNQRSYGSRLQGH